MMNRIILMTMVAVLLTTCSVSARVESMTINGERITSDVAPSLINGWFVVPISAVGKHVGAEIAWDAGSKTVRMHYEDNEIILKIGDAYARVNGVVRPMNVPATIVRNRTMVTAAFMADCIGTEVDWDYHSTTIVFKRVHDSTHKLESR